MKKILVYIIRLSGEGFTESSLAEIQAWLFRIYLYCNCYKNIPFAIRIKDIPVKIINDSMIHSNKIHA
jgi:hypothetical protein